jgi:hypothetical protein
MTITVSLSLGGEEVGGLMKGDCDVSLDINQISRYCGLETIVERKISVGK